MDATSLFDCWDWLYEVDTHKYGRDGARREENIGMNCQSVNLPVLLQGIQQILELLHGEFFVGPGGQRQHQTTRIQSNPFIASLP
jgi:hypothetical protein